MESKRSAGGATTLPGTLPQSDMSLARHVASNVAWNIARNVVGSVARHVAWTSFFQSPGSRSFSLQDLARA